MPIVGPPPDDQQADHWFVTCRSDGAFVFLTHHRSPKARPVAPGTEFKKGDRAMLLVDLERAAEISQRLDGAGWTRVAT